MYGLLPPHAAEAINSHYIKRARTHTDARMTEVFSENENSHQWETTLQSVKTRDGHDRTIQRLERHLPCISDQFALEEVKYYAIIADLHLQNITTLYDLIAAQSDLAKDERTTFSNTQLMAVCCSVEQAVSVVKQTVHQAQAHHTLDEMRPPQTPQPPANSSFKNVACSTVSAMVALAGPQASGLN